MAGKRSVASASLSSNYRRVTTSFSSTSKSSKISSNRTSGSGKLNSGTSKSSSASRASKTRADLTAFVATRNLPQMGGGYTSTSATAGKTSSDPASTSTVSSSVPNTNIASAASVAATVSITRGTMLVNNESGSVVKRQV